MTDDQERFTNVCVRNVLFSHFEEPECAVDINAIPVAAQLRFRRPQKGHSDWSPWQPSKIVLDRPPHFIDTQGYQVEYRLLYTHPQERCNENEHN